MQQVYSNVTKLMIDSRAGSNLLYLPIDRLLQSGRRRGRRRRSGAVGATGADRDPVGRIRHRRALARWRPHP
jgi:membrane protease subunit HflK